MWPGDCDYAGCSMRQWLNLAKTRTSLFLGWKNIENYHRINNWVFHWCLHMEQCNTHFGAQHQILLIYQFWPIAYIQRRKTLSGSLSVVPDTAAWLNLHVSVNATAKCSAGHKRVLFLNILARCMKLDVKVGNFNYWNEIRVEAFTIESFEESCKEVSVFFNCQWNVNSMM